MISRKRLALLAGIAFCAPVRAQQEGVCPQFEVPATTPVLEIDERLIIEADEVDLDREGLSTLAGAVRLSQGGREFTADQIQYDESKREVIVRAQSLFRNPDLIIHSEQARFDLNAETGVFSQTTFTLPARAARGTSEEIRLAREGTAELADTAYTSCAPGDESWSVQAARIRLDRDRGLGTARHATLRFAGVPVLYLPYFQFPIDDRRRTGLLFPTFGQRDNTGFDLLWPTYINLAPNYDATVTPRLMTERGLQLGVGFRYLLPRSEGTARVEYLDDDRFGDERRLLTLEHSGLLSDRLGVRVDFADVTDREYFEDLGGSLETSSLTHLEQSARLVYQSPGSYRVQALVQRYQPIANALQAEDDPYRRLPQLRLDVLTPGSLFDTRAGLNAEVVNFVRDNSVEGVRGDLRPYLLYLHDETAWYVSGQADLHYTAYDLDDQSAGLPDNPDRTLPVVSAEAGLRFERRTAGGALQTLEPRGFALYVPYENQDELPLFDTGEPDFDFVQLFGRNRYSNVDRISDARHVAGALTTRMIDPSSGVVRWSASVGQLFRFQAPRVELPEQPAPPSGATEFIAEADYRWTDKWRTLMNTQWSPKTSEFERINLGLRYRDPLDGQRFDLAYRRREDLLEQLDLSFSWPLLDAWRLATRQRYSLEHDRSLENLIGLEYETCCWAVRTAYRRYVATNSGDFTSGIYVQFELKGLTSIGTGFNDMLPYAQEEDTDWYE